MRVAFLSYRDWANKVYQAVEKHPNVSESMIIFADRLDGFIIHAIKKFMPDIILICGLSNWDGNKNAELLCREFPEKIFGGHCAAHDKYTPGTPLQHQIIDGLKKTKHRIFKASYPELALRQYSHEVDLDLTGNMDDILEQMTATHKALFNMFLNDYPNVEWKEWPAIPKSEWKLPLKPHNSKLTHDEFVKMSTEQLYNVIRCREAPYPNVYLEDNEGYLYFERVRFKKK